MILAGGVWNDCMLRLLRSGVPSIGESGLLKVGAWERKVETDSSRPEAEPGLLRTSGCPPDPWLDPGREPRLLGREGDWLPDAGVSKNDDAFLPFTEGDDGRRDRVSMVLSVREGRGLEGDVAAASSAASSSTTVQDSPNPVSSWARAVAEIHCCEDWRLREPAVPELDRAAVCAPPLANLKG